MTERVDRVQVIKIWDETGPTLNQFYAGMHFSKRKKMKDRFKLLTREAVALHGTQPVVCYPVSIDMRITFGKGKRRYDWENCAVTMKMVQDALCHIGVLHDDNWKYISGGRMWTRRGDRSCIEIAIREGKFAIDFS